MLGAAVGSFAANVVGQVTVILWGKSRASGMCESGRADPPEFDIRAPFIAMGLGALGAGVFGPVGVYTESLSPFAQGAGEVAAGVVMSSVELAVDRIMSAIPQ
jgi:hypothetical protein